MPKSSARPARSRGSLHPQRLAGLKRYLRRPPLSCPALNSRRRLRPVQQCRKQEFLGGKHRHGNRLLGWRRWHSQCGLEHVAERPRQAVQFGVDVGERRMPRTRGSRSARLIRWSGPLNSSASPPGNPVLDNDGGCCRKLPEDLQRVVEGVDIDRHGRMVPKVYSKLQANAELRKASEDRRGNARRRRVDAIDHCRTCGATGAAGEGIGHRARSELSVSELRRSRSRRECQIGISGAGDMEKMQNASALVFISLLLAARTIIFRLITKVFGRFASVALIAAMVQVSLISPPSAQTASAENAREVLGSSPSETVEQIAGFFSIGNSRANRRYIRGHVHDQPSNRRTPNLANIPAIWFGSYGYLSKRAGRQR
jgi:hypothetical protein